MDRQDGERLSLFTPGPVDLPAGVKQVLSRDMIHHRSAAFGRILAGLQTSLKRAFLTGNPVVTLTSSGTGAMEAAVVNLFSPGERVVVPVSGKFSRRWAEISRAHGLEVSRMEFEPGQAPDAEGIVARLEEEGDVAGVLLTHCETSTGSLTDVGSISQAVYDLGRRRGRHCITCVDCVTSLCIDEFRMDEWHIDCAVGASQKGFLGPPGLAFVAAGGQALDRMAAAAGRRYYFDLRRYFDELERSPFTPAIPLVCAVKDSLETILGLGLPAVWRASRSAAAAVRLALETAGLDAVAVRQASGVVAFWTEDLDAEKLAAGLWAGHGIVVAQGQQDLKGKILRVSPIGKGADEIRRFARALASVLDGMGRSLRLETIQLELDRLLEDIGIWESLRY